MSTEKENFDRRDQIIAALLWYGTWCASALIAMGMIFGCNSCVKAGVALFIFLPVARVALMLTIFLRERDYVYTLIAALVLSIIVIGIVIQLRLEKAKKPTGIVREKAPFVESPR
jgi:uncharacterized membrane protein